jgi:hypothetical protein
MNRSMLESKIHRAVGADAGGKSSSPALAQGAAGGCHRASAAIPWTGGGGGGAVWSAHCSTQLVPRCGKYD